METKTFPILQTSQRYDQFSWLFPKLTLLLIFNLFQSLNRHLKYTGSKGSKGNYQFSTDPQLRTSIPSRPVANLSILKEFQNEIKKR